MELDEHRFNAAVNLWCELDLQFLFGRQLQECTKMRNMDGTAYLRVVFPLNDACDDGAENNTCMGKDSEDVSLELDSSSNVIAASAIAGSRGSIRVIIDWCLHPVYLMPSAFINLTNSEGSALGFHVIQDILKKLQLQMQSASAQPNEGISNQGGDVEVPWVQEEHPELASPSFTLSICEMQGRLGMMGTMSRCNSAVGVNEGTVISHLYGDLLNILRMMNLVGTETNLYSISSAAFIRAEQLIEEEMRRL